MEYFRLIVKTFCDSVLNLDSDVIAKRNFPFIKDLVNKVFALIEELSTRESRNSGFLNLVGGKLFY